MHLIRAGLFTLIGLAHGALAQSVPFSFTNLNLPLTPANNTYTTALTATGTATFTGLGNATVKATGSATRERGLNCGNYLQLTLVATFNSTDSLTLFLSWPVSAVGTPQPFAVLSGTGIFQGQSGAGSMTLTLSLTNSSGAFALNGNGAGTLLSQPLTVASIAPGGIVPIFSSVPIIQPGSWISIYGNNFVAAASASTVSSGAFPTSLAGVSVSIDNKPGYLWVVSPNQINVQAPDDSITGCVNVAVTTPNGTLNSQVVLQPQQPSFNLFNGANGSLYVAGYIPTPDGSGAYAGGTYDLVGPANAFAFKARPVKVGETVVLYGVGFGSTAAKVPSGQLPAAATTTSFLPQVTIGGVPASVTYAALVGQGLYQINVVTPNVPSGDQLITATVPATGAILFSADTTQSCKDPDPQGALPTNCAVYITVR